jgi:hypothetical protein
LNNIASLNRELAVLQAAMLSQPFLSKGAYSWTVSLHEQRLLSGKLVVME